MGGMAKRVQNGRISDERQEGLERGHLFGCLMSGEQGMAQV